MIFILRAIIYCINIRYVSWEAWYYNEGNRACLRFVQKGSSSAALALLNTNLGWRQSPVAIGVKFKTPETSHHLWSVSVWTERINTTSKTCFKILVGTRHCFQDRLDKWCLLTCSYRYRSITNSLKHTHVLSLVWVKCEDFCIEGKIWPPKLSILPNWHFR